jgi:hypothetical protein
VPLRYAVPQPDLATCLTRVGQRRAGDPDDFETFAFCMPGSPTLATAKRTLSRPAGHSRRSRPPYSLLSRRDTSGHLVVSGRMASMPEMIGEVEAEAPRIEGSRRGRS